MSTLSKKLRSLKDYREIKDKKMKDQIIVEYAPLVKYIALKISSRLPSNVELDDLISCGVIGLMDAIEKFDSSRDNKFKTYAEFRIRGAILDELRSQDWVPRSVREKSKILERASAKLEQQLGRPPTDTEMCTEINVTKAEFQDMVNKAQSVSLLNIDDLQTFSKNDRLLMAGFADSDKANNPLFATTLKSARDKIKEGIMSLPEKQRLVLSLYYYEDLNLKEIGQVLDVTESRVSQLHTQAVTKLKTKLKSVFETPEDLVA